MYPKDMDAGGDGGFKLGFLVGFIVGAGLVWLFL